MLLTTCLIRPSGSAIRVCEHGNGERAEGYALRVVGQMIENPSIHLAAKRIPTKRVTLQGPLLTTVI